MAQSYSVAYGAPFLAHRTPDSRRDEPAMNVATI